MYAELVSIGTELLLGEIVDTNAPYIARKAREIGLDVIFKTTVGDNEDRIAHVIDHALNRVDVVITTGGLGPTVDDVTREAIARATNRPLEFRQDLLDQIEERFKRFGARMSENNRRQAHIPLGARPIVNPVGTAPIFILETERGVVMTLPGVPREMKYLLEHALLPWLREYVGAPAVIKSRVLRTAGVGESQIDMRIGDLMTAANPTVALAAHTGQTDVRITAKAPTEAEADAMIAPLEQEIRQRLGSWIYGVGEETIEEVLLRLLAERGESLACVEIGTEGLLSERLQRAGEKAPDVPVHSLSLSRVEELETLGIDAGVPLRNLVETTAQAIRNREGTTYGMAVIIRSGEEEDGIATIESAIAVASEEGCRTRIFTWALTRTDAPIWVTTHALAMLRHLILRSQQEG